MRHIYTLVLLKELTQQERALHVENTYNFHSAVVIGSLEVGYFSVLWAKALPLDGRELQVKHKHLLYKG